MIHSHGSRLHLETTPTNFIPAADSIPCCNGGTSAGLEPSNVHSTQSLSEACRFTVPLVAALDMVDQYQLLAFTATWRLSSLEGAGVDGGPLVSRPDSHLIN